MQNQVTKSRPVSGHVKLVEGKRRPVWFARYRLPNGKQVQQRLGPAWLTRKAAPEGWLTEADAKRELNLILLRAQKGELGGTVRTGVTLGGALDAFLEWKADRGMKHSTLRGYRRDVVKLKREMPDGADQALEAVTTAKVEKLRDDLVRAGRSNRTVNKHLGLLNHFYDKFAVRTYGLPGNPVDGVERRPHKATIHGQALTPEEVFSLERHAASDQDAAIFVTAALTGLRLGELLELRVRDLNFPGSLIQVRRSVNEGVVGPPKNGKPRTVPMAPEVAERLAKLLTRDEFTGDDDLVFVNDRGGYVGDRKLFKRYQEALAAADLPPIRFHDLRDTFGSVAINRVDLLKLREWYGHARLSTTEKYLQYRDRGDDAALIADAFSRQPIAA